MPMQPDGTPGPARPDADGHADPPAGAFVPTQKLGAGAMGEVWKAWDSRLSRWVALKFLKGADPEERARFRREAQTAGRLTHPNICAIYEATDTYIAMQLVDGQTLKTVPRVDRRRIATLIRDAARAVAYAHEQGVVHRDIKPDNLMVTAAGHLYVMDFGLARTVEGDVRLSASGTMVGTPAYMPPEQARAETVDGRADVYSLGATLYELLTGRIPFEGDNILDVLVKVVEQDPAPPSSLARQIDADLETIVLKCLEKDRAHRYAGARELADDLDRWLQDEPITARRTGILYRLSRRFAKRKGVVATAAAGLLAAGLLSAVLIPKLRRAEGSRARLEAQLVQQMRQISDAYLKLALAARRADNLEEMSSYLPEVERVCVRVTQEVPWLAEPHHRRGRMLRVLMRDDEALAEQDAALRKEPAYAPARYERVVHLARVYRRRLRELYDSAQREAGLNLGREGDIRPGTGIVRPRMDELVNDDAEAARLQRLLQEDVTFLQSNHANVSEAQQLAAAGLQAWVTRRSEARGLLEQALQLDPNLEEAYEARATLDAEASRYSEAIAWWTKGIDRDRGNVSLWTGRGDARRYWGYWIEQRGEDALEVLISAIEDYSEAIKRDPARVELYLGRGDAHGHLGAYESRRGRDPSGPYKAAIADLNEALKLNSARDDAWRRRGGARVNWGNSMAERGEDPSEPYAAAIADLDEAIKRNPASDETWAFRATAHGNWGLTVMRRGGDPSKLFSAAIHDYGEALKIRPATAGHWLKRGSVYGSWGQVAAASGSDPANLYAAAIRDCDEALRYSVRREGALIARGRARNNWGLFLTHSGKDPATQFAAAVDDFGEAVRLSPGLDEAWTGRGMTRGNWGAFKSKRGDDPSESYTAAIDDFTEALRRNPGREETWTERGCIRVNWALFKKARGQDPTDLFQAAIADFGETIKRNPGGDGPWLNRAKAQSNWGAYRREKGLDPSALFASAVSDCGEALKRNPTRSETWVARGGARVNWGQYARDRGEDPSEHLAAGVDDLSEALRLNPSNATAHEFRGHAYYARAHWRVAKRQDASADLRAALADYNEGVRLDPLLNRRLSSLIAACRRALGDR